MSEAKADRSVAPREGTRASRAKQTRDRNVRPPPAKYAPVSKRKRRGASKIPPRVPTSLVEHEDVVAAPPSPPPEPPEATPDPDYPEVPKDPWWTQERELAFTYAMQGLHKSQIARELGRERHAIARWMDDQRFADRMYEENLDRFKTSRQRRVMQTVRLTDKAHTLADKMLDAAEKDPANMNSRFAARDWLSEFREQSRREDEMYGLDKQRVDVNVHGVVQHKHRGTIDLSFKDFLLGSMKKLGVDVESEVIDAGRADEALVAITERALMEGTFLEELVEQEKQDALAPMLRATATER